MTEQNKKEKKKFNPFVFVMMRDFGMGEKEAKKFMEKLRWKGE